VGICGGQSEIVRVLCGGLWWTEWLCNRFMWGGCGGQSVSVIGLCGGL